MAYDFLNDSILPGFNHGASPKRQVIFIKIQNYVCLNEKRSLWQRERTSECGVLYASRCKDRNAKRSNFNKSVRTKR